MLNDNLDVLQRSVLIFILAGFTWEIEKLTMYILFVWELFHDLLATVLSSFTKNS